MGFRPTVHRLATARGLAGSVRNSPGGAVVEVEGPEEAVERFARDLREALPPLARLDGLSVEPIPPTGQTAFEILDSEPGARRGALVPPDAALCPACRSEMEDPADRRHRYPFTTCTHCGPRLSLAITLPYDRERTSMACFPLCPACRREYEDPADRRFHAEPVCCPECGPRLRLLRPDGAEVAGDPLEEARRALAGGAIVAVKGIGGFQLACRADDAAAIARLRQRKARPTKPFAVMVPDLPRARALAVLAPGDEALLRSPKGPVVLAPRRAGGVREEVAPGIADLGLLLPTTPLHVELFRGAAYGALVMTSGNAGDEPICRGNREAVARLGAIADLLLVHDRDVVRRVDDSVVRSAPSGPILVRRSRGWVPEPLPLPEPAPDGVLALGAHLQATACVAAGDEAFPSQHVGDLDTEPARAFLLEVAAGLESFLQVRAAAVAVDLHPDYPSTWAGEALAGERGARLVRLQHHVAHAAAVLAEHACFPRPGERAGALVLDGTGFGPDGTAWGGEGLVLHGDLAWERPFHLAPVPLVGGERAVREPWRVAAACVRPEVLERTPLASLVPAASLRQVAALAGGSWPRATGAGRLFEAAGSLCGLAAVNGWEGEAAARLEALAAPAWERAERWPEAASWGPALLAAAAERLAAGEPPASVAAGFHRTFVDLAASAAAGAFPRGTAVALGGGCLVNRLLSEGLAAALERAGLRPLRPRRLPPGDGGISYGQAVLAAVSLARGETPRPKGA